MQRIAARHISQSAYPRAAQLLGSKSACSTMPICVSFMVILSSCHSPAIEDHGELVFDAQQVAAKLRANRGEWHHGQQPAVFQDFQPSGMACRCECPPAPRKAARPLLAATGSSPAATEVFIYC